MPSLKSHRFRLYVAVRVALLTATIGAFLLLLLRTELYVTVALAGVAAVVQAVGLVRYVEETNRALSRFLLSVRYEDFQQSFTGRKLGYSFDELYAAFSEVMADFKKARAAEEANYRYLQTVVQHVGIGLIAFTRDGRVELVNTAAKRILRVQHLKHLHALDAVHPGLSRRLLMMSVGDKELLKFDNGGELLQLVVYATAFKLQGVPYTLVSLQNIGVELEEKEMEAWQNLTRVLAHEIMNSVTPISSLAGTVNGLLAASGDGAGGDRLDPETIEDVRGAMHTIEKRSQGLLHFVDAYRNLARVPRPALQICGVAELFDRIERLFRPKLEEAEVELTLDVSPESLELIADPELVEQILINLVKNAVEALQERPPPRRLRLRAEIDDWGKIVVQVIDNGPGFTPEQIEKAFVPFYTTKPNGSGIGLSFSRQIMRRHGGTLRLHSRPGEKTVFTLRF